MNGRLLFPLLLSLDVAAATNSVPPEMALVPLPLHAPEPPNNPGTPSKVALGRLLFFDPILSATGDVACATCHNPAYGWADGRTVPIGVGGEGLGPARLLRGASDLRVLERHVPALMNVGFNGLVAGAALDPDRSPLFWDSRVEGLEAQVAYPLRAREEMRGDACAERDAIGGAVRRIGNIPEYREHFATAFNEAADTAVTETHLTQAIAAFERSLVAPNSAYDRFLRGDTQALNPIQQRGLREFQDAGCAHCHGGPMLSDFKLHVLGVPDPTPGGRRAFRTPTLRQLGETAPYMHHGRFRTLDEVLQFYEELMEAAGESLDGGDTSLQPPLDPLLRHLRLRPDSATDLRAFLEALQDDHFDRTVPRTVPSRLPVGGR